MEEVKGMIKKNNGDEGWLKLIKKYEDIIHNVPIDSSEDDFNEIWRQFKREGKGNDRLNKMLIYGRGSLKSYLREEFTDTILNNIQSQKCPDINLLINDKTMRGCTDYIKDLLTDIRSGIRDYDKTERKYNIYMWGEHHMGKSMMCRMLSTIYPAYTHPNSNWYVSYSNNTYRFIMRDEMKFNTSTLDTEKKILSGEAVNLERKKGEGFDKKDNIITIGNNNETLDKLLNDVLSNKDAETKKAFKSRFKEYMWPRIRTTSTATLSRDSWPRRSLVSSGSYWVIVTCRT